MVPLIRSELLKMRHTFALKLVVLAPVITVLLGYGLSPHDFQYSAYNWWYTVLLPIVISLWSASMVSREKSTGMHNMIALPIRTEKVWLGKMAALAVLLASAHIFLWGIATALGLYTTATISPTDSLIGCALLVLTYAWQLPFIAWLADKTGYLVAVITSSAANLVLSSIGATKAWFMLIPYAIPARVVAPFFHMQPNGLPLESGSPLLDTGVVIPAIAVSIGWALVLLWGCAKGVGRGSDA